MATLYLMSVEGEVGKTALAFGLALQAKDRGLRVGYFKPVGVRIDSASGHLVESDAAFMKQALGLDESVDQICPVLLTEVVRREVIEGRTYEAAAAIRTAFAQVARDKDLVIVDGPPTTRQGITLGVEPPRVAEMLDASVVVVLRGEYQNAADAALLAQTQFGKRLIGAIINSAPVASVEDARTYFGPYLHDHGLELYGVTPIDPVLGAFTVGELAQLLNGRIVACQTCESTLVENFSVGAMGADVAVRYFLRTANKAVITGGDRTDIILAALDTPTRCIILTGNLVPDHTAVTKATDRRVPIILVPLDTLETVRRIDEARGPIRLASAPQIERLRQLIRNEVDVDGLLGRLGVG